MMRTVWGGLALVGSACLTGLALGGGVPGDDCSDCIPLDTNQPYLGTTASATGETSSSCGGSAELWHCWTADCDGLATVSLCSDQTEFDTVVSIFDSCNGAEVNCNDDACPEPNTLQSEVSMLVNAGTPYRIRVAGFLGATGPYSLQVTCDSGPLNDNCEGAEALSVGTTPFTTINASDRTSPLPLFCDEGFGSDIDRDVWYDFTADCTGVVDFSTCDSADFDTRLALYEGCDCPVDPDDVIACNDDGTGCTGFTSTLRSAVNEGTCYKLRLGGFAGQSGTGNLRVDCTESRLACLESTEECLATHLSPGCNERVCCETICAQDAPCCTQEWDQLCVDRANVFCAPAANDLCADAPIETLPHTYVGNNITATHECDRFPGNHVWIAFELTETSDVTLNYCGSLPVFASAWLNLAFGCPCEGNSLSAASCFLCPDGNVEMQWPCVPPGIYYYPVLSAPGAQGGYRITVEGVPCSDPNACADANPIQDGRTLFNTILASTDGPPLPIECNRGEGLDIRRDVWFNYEASCTGQATFSTCGSPIFNARMALYDGDECPVSNRRLTACDNGGVGCDGATSVLTADVIEGEVYTLRVGSPDGQTGGGCVEIQCVPDGPTCPPGELRFVEPPSGVVDARQPYPLMGGALLGIDEILVEAPDGADAVCFELCETDTGTWDPNVITEVLPEAEGRYRLRLDRPITPGAVTTIRYVGDPAAVGLFTSHPANVDGDGAAVAMDIIHVIDFLNEISAPPWGVYSSDVDHNGGFGPSDILRLIDLLNGADAFDPWNGTSKPTADGICP